VSGVDILALVGSVVLVVFAAILAVAETAFTHLGRARAEAIDNARSGKTREKEGNGDGTDPAHAGVLVGLLERRGQVLNPILFLVLMCHLAVATIVAIVAHDRWGVGAVLAALAIELVVIYVVAEAAPKTWALEHTDVAAVRVAPLVRGLAALAPLRWVLRLLIGLANLLVPGRARREGPTVSEDELLALAGVAAEAAVIDASERTLIESIIDFGDTIAREVMVPRTEMVTVGHDFRVDAAIEVAIAHGFSRLPAYGEGGIDDIAGIIYAKDLMRAERDGHIEEPIDTMLRPARLVPETKRVAELLREMQTEQFHIAIVIDEYGGTAGLVTLEDVIEELVGEIQDEFDVEEPMVDPAGAGGIRVHARMAVDEVNALLTGELPEDGDWDSVGGLVYHQVGHVPAEGESVEIAGYRLSAEKVQGRRIGRVRITPLPPDDGRRDDGEGWIKAENVPLR
jgi:CBS domain containing-hemolysin-like protein